VIGRQQLPSHHLVWNRRWGAPYGYRSRHLLRPQGARFRVPQVVGPFGFQPDNSITRRLLVKR